MTPLLSSAFAIALALGEPQPAAAPPDVSLPAPRLSLGARAGVALPLGELESGLSTRDVVSRVFPLELRAAWRFTPELEVGIQGGFSPGVVAGGLRGDCTDERIACSAHLWTLAARGEYSRRGRTWTQWGALSLGWERLSERWEEAADNWDQKRWDGWLAGLEAGVDRSVKRYLDLGFFAGVSLGQYRWVSLKGAAPGYEIDDSGWVPGPALHGWVSLGLRGTFAL